MWHKLICWLRGWGVPIPSNWERAFRPGRTRKDGRSGGDENLPVHASEKRGRFARWFGNTGEKAAEKYLVKLGMRVLFRQYETDMGEIDLICRDGDTVVFVEVKTRRDTSRGNPADAVDRDKQHQLTRLALAFLKQHKLLNHSARFDVVAIIWPVDSKQPTITHHKNAFESTGHGQLYS